MIIPELRWIKSVSGLPTALKPQVFWLVRLVSWREEEEGKKKPS